MLGNIITAVVLLGYLGAPPADLTLRNTIVLAMFRPNTIAMPEGKASAAAVEEVSLPSSVRDLLTAYKADSIYCRFPDYQVKIGITSLGDTVRSPDLSRLFRIKFPEGTDLDLVVDSLSNLPEIEHAERYPIINLFVTPNDQFFHLQWGLHNTGQSGGTVDADIDAPEAWEIETGCASVKIGIIDEGVKSDHEDLLGKVSGDVSYFGDHGTHVAGIAAANTNNATGVAGVSWGAQIHAEALFFPAPPEDLVDAIVSAVDAGCDILNASWGSPHHSALLRRSFAYAYRMNVAAVASMGNAATSIPSYPAAFSQGIIAVGATIDEDVHTWWSNSGSHIDVVAPGGINSSSPMEPKGHLLLLDHWNPTLWIYGWDLYVSTICYRAFCTIKIPQPKSL